MSRSRCHIGTRTHLIQEIFAGVGVALYCMKQELFLSGELADDVGCQVPSVIGADGRGAIEGRQQPSEFAGKK